MEGGRFVMAIIVVNDDVHHVKAVQLFISRMGHRVFHASTADRILELLDRESIDVILIDWSPSAGRDLPLLRKIREHAAQKVALICLVNQTLETTLMSGEGLLFDDYILKPYSGMELLEKIDTWRERHGISFNHDAPFKIGFFEIDSYRRTITLRGDPICTSPKEFFLLLFFFRNAGKILSRQLIFVAAWGRPLTGVSRTLDTHIYRLRKKVGLLPENGVRLSSVYTLGYRLDEIYSCRDSPKKSSDDEHSSRTQLDMA